MSDSQCELCCQSEAILKALQGEFKAGNYMNKVRFDIYRKFQKNQIKIARVDVAKKYNFVDKEYLRVETQPSVFVFFEGSYYIYEGNRSSEIEFLHWMNKLINPIVTLNTDEEI